MLIVAIVVVAFLGAMYFFNDGRVVFDGAQALIRPPVSERIERAEYNAEFRKIAALAFRKTSWAWLTIAAGLALIYAISQDRKTILLVATAISLVAFAASRVIARISQRSSDKMMLNAEAERSLAKIADAWGTSREELLSAADKMAQAKS